MKKKKLSFQEGQVLILVTLTMIVVLTVGLSIASRTITNLKISKQNEESQRAFQAAEAGIERTLKELVDQAETLSDTVTSFRTIYTNTAASSLLLNGGSEVDQNIGIDVWLSDYPDYSDPSRFIGNVTIYWATQLSPNQDQCGGSGEREKPAIEILLLTGTRSNPTLNKRIIDPCARIPGSELGGGLGSVGTESFHNQITITTTAVNPGLIMKVIPLYNSGRMGVSATADLPRQGTSVESIGQSGDTVRRIRYFQSHPQIPVELFQYAILSQ